MAELSPKHARFVAEYLVDLNATQAAVRAGYSSKTALQQGSRLLLNVDISAAIKAGASKQLEGAGLTAQKVLNEIALHGFSNVQDLFDEQGNLRPIHTLTREQAACISSLEVIKKNATSGDGQTDIVHKVKVVEKTKSLEMLAKHFALLTDVVRLDASAELVSKLTAARKRIASIAR